MKTGFVTYNEAVAAFFDGVKMVNKMGETALKETVEFQKHAMDQMLSTTTSMLGQFNEKVNEVESVLKTK